MNHREVRMPGGTLTSAAWLLGCLLLAADGLSACSTPFDVGRAVTADPRTIKVGETTKEDVLQHFGNPDAIWIDERVFAYTWDHFSGDRIVVGFAAMSVSPGTHEVLLIQFDERGLVQRLERTERPSDIGMGEFVKSWTKRGVNAKN